MKVKANKSAAAVDQAIANVNRLSIARHWHSRVRTALSRQTASWTDYKLADNDDLSFDFSVQTKLLASFIYLFFIYCLNQANCP